MLRVTGHEFTMGSMNLDSQPAEHQGQKAYLIHENVFCCLLVVRAFIQVYPQ